MDLICLLCIDITQSGHILYSIFRELTDKSDHPPILYVSRFWEREVTLSISNIPSYGFYVDITDGKSQTLTSIFSDLLTEAESRYGVRNRDFTPVGIEFYSHRQPRMYIIPGTKNISILLPETSMTNMNEAVFHLCHEIIHILGPKDSEDDQRKILSIEEGLATYFQYEMAKKI